MQYARIHSTRNATLPRVRREKKALQWEEEMEMCESNVMIRRLHVSRFLNEYKFGDVALNRRIFSSKKNTSHYRAIAAILLNLQATCFRLANASSVTEVCSPVTSHFELGTLHIFQLHHLASSCLLRLIPRHHLLDLIDIFRRLPPSHSSTTNSHPPPGLALALSRAHSVIPIALHGYYSYNSSLQRA